MPDERARSRMYHRTGETGAKRKVELIFIFAPRVFCTLSYKDYSAAGCEPPICLCPCIS